VLEYRKQARLSVSEYEAWVHLGGDSPPGPDQRGPVNCYCSWAYYIARRVDLQEAITKRTS